MVHFPTCPTRSRAKYCNLVNPRDTSIRMSNTSTIYRAPQPPPNVGSLQPDAQGIARARFTVLVTEQLLPHEGYLHLLGTQGLATSHIPSL